MSFKKIEKWTGVGSTRASQTVKVSRINSHGNGLKFSISGDIAETLKFSVGERYDLLAGTGEDAGKIALRRSGSLSARKFTRLAGNAGASIFTIAAQTIQAERPEHVTVLPYSIEDEALVIDIRPIMPRALSKAAA